MSPERLKLVKELLLTDGLHARDAAKSLFQLEGYTFLNRGNAYMKPSVVLLPEHFYPSEREAMLAECDRLEKSAPA